MRSTIAPFCAALALGPILAACNKDAATAPAKTLHGPSMTVVSDTGGGGGAGQSHFVANGNSGFVSWSSSGSGDTLGGGGGFTFGELNVSRGGSVNNPQTFLFYFIEQCDPFFGCTLIEGSGLIPNNDLSGGGQQLHLATNTIGNPNFFTFGGPPGLVTVDWRANGAFQQRNSGTSDFIVPGFRQHSVGISTSASASAVGSVVGSVIPAGSIGTIGTNQNVSIDIFH
jgi:hypothetical protein